jgi:hypothetical protein
LERRERETEIPKYRDTPCTKAPVPRCGNSDSEIVNRAGLFFVADSERWVLRNDPRRARQRRQFLAGCGSRANRPPCSPDLPTTIGGRPMNVKKQIDRNKLTVVLGGPYCFAKTNTSSSRQPRRTVRFLFLLRPSIRIICVQRPSSLPLRFPMVIASAFTTCGTR